MNIPEDRMKKREAQKAAKQIKQIYPSNRVWVDLIWDSGYAVNISHNDGAYGKRLKTKECVEDYIRIHSEE